MKIGFKTWREDLERYRIEVVSKHEAYLLANSIDTLTCTRCSATKGNRGDKEIPKYFYTSIQNTRFYKRCEELNIRYGVLSDKYGLHLHDEKLSFYDIHPSQLSGFDFRRLGSKIYFKMDSLGCSSFLFYNPSPVPSRPYFRMMITTGFKIYYTTKLP